MITNLFHSLIYEHLVPDYLIFIPPPPRLTSVLLGTFTTQAITNKLVQFFHNDVANNNEKNECSEKQLITLNTNEIEFLQRGNHQTMAARLNSVLLSIWI